MSTGFMPGVIVKNIAAGSNDPAITPVGVVLHVAVSTADSLQDYFAHRSGGIESHFYVRTDGKIEQYRSVFREADAQLDGNSFTYDGRRCGFVSVETEGMGPGKWSDAQLAAIKRIIEWVHTQHAFPWRVCPAWNAPGVGYHTLFGAPSHWTPVAKSCPGPERVKQFNAVIVPWLKQKAAATHTPTESEEDEMTPAQMQELKDYIDLALKRSLYAPVVPAVSGSEADKHYHDGKPMSQPNTLYWLLVELVKARQEIGS